MKKNALAWLVLLAACVATGACTLQFDTTLKPDGSGKLVAGLGLTPSDQQSLAESGRAMPDLCRPDNGLLALPAGVNPEIELRGEDLWCIAEFEFSNLETLQAALSGQPGLTVNQLQFDDNQFVFDVTIDLTHRLNLAGERLPAPDLVWALTLPGILAGHNADLVEGNALLWRATPGELRSLRAESVLSVPTRLPLRTMAVLTGGILILGCLLPLLGAAIWWRRRRRSH